MYVEAATSREVLRDNEEELRRLVDLDYRGPLFKTTYYGLTAGPGGIMEKADLRRAWDEIQEKIRPVLMEVWDPIGVSDVPEAADEYDGYIGGIYVLLRDSASDERIAQHLYESETKTMGLGPVAHDGYEQLIARLRSLTLPDLSYPRDLDGG